jgi:hypothetical protein
MGGLTIPCGEDVFLEITSSLNWILCNSLRISQDWRRYTTKFCSCLVSYFQKIFSFVNIILGCKKVSWMRNLLTLYHISLFIPRTYWSENWSIYLLNV